MRFDYSSALRPRFFLKLTQVLTLALLPAVGMAQEPSSPEGEGQELTQFSVEDLLNVEVTSVSKRTQSLSDAPAAVFVITNDDLRRSGVTNIPDALRMVPGLNVARIDANKWAVTARGFNGRFANKLLVLVDGRSVYTPVFSGVYWESVDVPLHDVDRIEVIRGPGATLWGANAVNGVINILTKHSADTQGGWTSLAGGNMERAAFGVRYGTALGDATYGRAYLKGSKRSEFELSTGSPADDQWDTQRIGFRVDSQFRTRDGLTVQGDFYRDNLNQTVVLPSLSPPYLETIEESPEVRGANILGRWQHTSSPRSVFTLQAFHDRFERDELVVKETRRTTDFELQHQLLVGERQDIVWGLGYRYTRDELTNSSVTTVDPGTRNSGLFNAFIQDEIVLVPQKLRLTLGSKFEHNDYSGWEIQPNVRLFWTARPKHKFWTSISRAVRTPSRAEHDASFVTAVLPPSPVSPLPVALVSSGGTDFDSEELVAYELGYRVVPVASVALDLTLFHQEYDNLRSISPAQATFQGTYLEQSFLFGNQKSGNTNGVELAASWQAADWWSWDLAYSYFNLDLDASEAAGTSGYVPRHQLSIRSSVNPSKEIELDFWLRSVGAVEAIDGRNMRTTMISDYTTLDIRLAWRPRRDLELALIGQNLLQDSHLEYVQEILTLPTEVPRGIYGKVEWSF